MILDLQMRDSRWHACLIQHREDLMAGLVSPPTSANGLTRYVLGQARYRAAGGLQHDAVLMHPLEGFHDGLFKHEKVRPSSAINRPSL